LSEFVNIVGHDFYHPLTIFMDAKGMSSSACQVCASTAALPMTMGCHPPCTRFNRELNRKRLSQPDPDRVSLTAAWPDQPAGAYIGRM
jgi:hypothetical protein